MMKRVLLTTTEGDIHAVVRVENGATREHSEIDPEEIEVLILTDRSGWGEQAAVAQLRLAIIDGRIRL